MVAKPRVNVQGKVVVERCQDCGDCQEWLLDPPSANACRSLLVMLPDGSISRARSPASAYRVARQWFARHTREAINVGRIEWRHGVLPPARKG